MTGKSCFSNSLRLTRAVLDRLRAAPEHPLGFEVGCAIAIRGLVAPELLLSRGDRGFGREDLEAVGRYGEQFGVDRLKIKLAGARDLIKKAQFQPKRWTVGRRAFLRALGMFVCRVTPRLAGEILARVVEAFCAVVHEDQNVALWVIGLGQWLGAVWSEEAMVGKRLWRGEDGRMKLLPDISEPTNALAYGLLDYVLRDADWVRLGELVKAQPEVAVENACMRRLLARQMSRPKDRAVTDANQLTLLAQASSAVAAAVAAGKLGRGLNGWELRDLCAIAGYREPEVGKKLYLPVYLDTCDREHRKGLMLDVIDSVFLYYERSPRKPEDVRELVVGQCCVQVGVADGRFTHLPIIAADFSAMAAVLWYAHKDELGRVPAWVAEEVKRCNEDEDFEWAKVEAYLV